MLAVAAGCNWPKVGAAKPALPPNPGIDCNVPKPVLAAWVCPAGWPNALTAGVDPKEGVPEQIRK